KSKTRNVQNWSKNIAPTRNNCAAERRIEEVLLRQPPGEHFPRREKSVRDRVLDFVRPSDQVHIIDDDSASELIGTADISSFDARLNDMTPPSKVALELRANQGRTVLEGQSI